MFRKREKKTFPPGTFIEPKARVAAILQLCFAFSMFLWIASQPFMGDLFTLKSDIALLETLFGTRAASAKDTKGLLERNAERFKSLRESDKAIVKKHYQKLRTLQKENFKAKLKKASLLVTTKTAPFIIALIYFSMLIPILLLKRFEGACEAAWLLPLLATLALFDNSHKNYVDLFSDMYPTEQILIEKHLQEPLKPKILEQHAQLTKAWQNYLIAQFVKEAPAKDIPAYEHQLERGEYAFNLELAKRLSAKDLALLSSLENKKWPPSVLFCFLLASLSLAIAATFSKQSSKRKKAC